MTDKFDAAIQEVALKHGVVLSKDDPILILQTMNDRLLEESRQIQAAMLAQFREEMEAISSQWKDDAREKAEKVLNAALVASKEAMANTLHLSTSELVAALRSTISDSLRKTEALADRAQKASRVIWLSAALLSATTCMMVLFYLI